MNFIIENWTTIVVVVILVIALGIGAYKFFTQPSKKQIEQVKSWLLYGVTFAEKELGSSVGKIKLHMVYDMFITRFPVISKLVTFNMFSLLVDQALIEMRDMLNSNKAAKELVNGEQLVGETHE